MREGHGDAEQCVCAKSALGRSAVELDHPSVEAALVDVALPGGNVAISMQSGTLGSGLLQMAAGLHLPISWFVSLGDKSDVSGNDLLQFWEDDEATSVIAIYSESLGNPGKFARIARRVASRRPIVTVRTGTAQGGLTRSALVPVTAGQPLTFQLWAKVAGGPSWAGVGLDFLDASGAELSEINLQVTSTAYALRSASQAVPAGATSAAMSVRPSNDSIEAIDLARRHDSRCVRIPCSLGRYGPGKGAASPRRRE